LLTRQWRDQNNGIELSFWANSDRGPLRLTVPAQEAVCFIERKEQLHLPPDCRRQAVELDLLHGEAVDALYFRKQRALNEFRQIDKRLLESDVKPADRYLMERFVTASCVAEGIIENKGSHLEMVMPKLTTAEYLPELKLLSLDIETQGLSDRLYSIAGHCGDDGRVFMLGEGPTQSRDGYELSFHANEKLVLQAFFTWLHAIDPDVIIGWSVVNFDLTFIERKCQQLNIPFAMGRGRDASTILQPGNQNQPRVARVPGRAVLDGIDLLKAAFWTFESYSLENVAQQLLGTGKLIQSDEDKLAEINRLFRDDKPQLADYNFIDCTLVTRIFAHADLIAFAMQRARMTGLPMDRMGGSVAAFDFLYLPRLHRKGVVAPDISPFDDGLGSPGGYVLDSEPGLYNNVLVLDFKSLYPSIIRTFCIDPLGMFRPGDNPIDGFLEASFSRDEHILPDMIASLWQSRDAAKQEDNKPLSQAIKIIMNSFYGVLGASGCRFHHQKLASSITRRGHEIITRTRDFIEEQGHRVIYGDTDSVFVWLGNDMEEDQANAIGTALMMSLNDWWSDNLRAEHDLTSYLEVEYETHYLRFLMPTVRGMATGSKKRYAGLIRTGHGEDTEMIFKGLEAVRTDWTPLAREFQRELYRRVFFNEPFDDYVRKIAEQLRSGELDDQLVYRKRLRRKLADYQRNVPPHVQAARKQRKPGHWVSYMITLNGPEPTDNLQSTPDYQHYLEKQLAPAADGILYFMETSFHTLTDAQMQMF